MTTTRRLAICRYCERYGRACGRTHTWDNVNAWHQTWDGHTRPVSIPLVNAILGGDPGNLIGKYVTVRPDLPVGRIVAVYGGGIYGAVVRFATGQQHYFQLSELTPAASPGGVGVQGDGDRVLDLVADIVDGHDNLGLADLSTTALERALSAADDNVRPDVLEEIRDELEFRKA